jgi:plasmid stability protein
MIPASCLPVSTLLDIIACSDINAGMAGLTIRDLDPETKERLRIRAARHGRSMEEEVRAILRAAMAESASNPVRLGTTIHDRFRAIGGVELELPPREPMREPPKLR